MADEQTIAKLAALSDHYYIAIGTEPTALSAIVSHLLKEGWKLHGDMKVHAAIDFGSPTHVGLYYIQAMTKGVA